MRRVVCGRTTGTHSDSFATKIASLRSQLHLKMATEGGDMEARISSMIQEAIERRLGPIVDQLFPLVTQQQTGPQPTGGESLLPILSHSLSRLYPAGATSPPQATAGRGREGRHPRSPRSDEPGSQVYTAMT